MRILFLGNNWVGWHIANWLFERGESVVGAVLHPIDRQHYGAELLGLMSTNSVPVFIGSELDQETQLQEIKKLKADIGVSVYFGYILKRPLLSMFSKGVVNLHPSYLPYNKGAHPNVWSIVEETPAGVTLHYIDEGIDTGDIIAQRRVDVEPIDTAKTLYTKLESACVELFQSAWSDLKEGRVKHFRQPDVNGTFHRSKDLKELGKIDLDRKYTARELLGILRARTFPPYPGAFFEQDGRKVHVRIELSYGDE